MQLDAARDAPWAVVALLVLKDITIYALRKRNGSTSGEKPPEYWLMVFQRMEQRQIEMLKILNQIEHCRWREDSD